MPSSVCTLFENHHHFGVAALTNSLHKQGFRGEIYAGYRGQLPNWADTATPDTDIIWPGANALIVTEFITIHFLPIPSSFHLAHFKPEFMIKLLEGDAKHSSALAYFDPDIVITCPWYFYERWMGFGVAMVHEIVSNDMPPTHPIRMEWKKVIAKLNRTTKRDLHAYLNCGFCGISIENVEFLKIWLEVIQEAIINYNMDPDMFSSFNRTNTFWSIDQDAFNIAAMCCECPISEMGPEAMDFSPAGWTMSHATGSPKPWNKNFLKASLNGFPPSKADKEFWMNVEGPLLAFRSFQIKKKRTALSISSLIGRFYRRS